MSMAEEAVGRFEKLEDLDRMATAKDLEPIVRAASSGSRPVADLGVPMLLELAQRHPAALDALLGLATHADETVRLHLVEWIDEDVPADLATELVRFVVHDEAAEVRLRAAERIAELDLDLVAELRDGVDRERDPVVRDGLAAYLAVATGGYYLVPAEGDRVSVWMRLDCGAWCTFDLSRDEVDTGLLPEHLDRERERFADV